MSVFIIITILLSVYLTWSALFQGYEINNKTKTETKVKYPLIVVILFMMLSIIPVCGILSTGVLYFWFFVGNDSWGTTRCVKSILFKKI